MSIFSPRHPTAIHPPFVAKMRQTMLSPCRGDPFRQFIPSQPRRAIFIVSFCREGIACPPCTLPRRDSISREEAQGEGEVPFLQKEEYQDDFPRLRRNDMPQQYLAVFVGWTQGGDGVPFLQKEEYQDDFPRPRRNDMPQQYSAASVGWMQGGDEVPSLQKRKI